MGSLIPHVKTLFEHNSTFAFDFWGGGGEASRRGVAQAAASINEIRTFSQGQLARFLERAAINNKIKVS